MIQFQPFTKADFDTLISWITSEEALIQFSGPVFKYPLTKEQLILNTSDPKRHAYTIVESLTGKMIAYAEIFTTIENIAVLDRIIIGDLKMRGKGIGLQIVQQLLYISFEILGAERASLFVFDWNTSAIKCYEKAGFIINNDKTRKLEFKGETWMVLNMSIGRFQKEINSTA
jgi:RimJ/RimL family protein N-acetyltransferase